jgi:hypothetical protein
MHSADDPPPPPPEARAPPTRVVSPNRALLGMVFLLAFLFTEEINEIRVEARRLMAASSSREVQGASTRSTYSSLRQHEAAVERRHEMVEAYEAEGGGAGPPRPPSQTKGKFGDEVELGMRTPPPADGEEEDLGGKTEAVVADASTTTSSVRTHRESTPHTQAFLGFTSFEKHMMEGQFTATALGIQSPDELDGVYGWSEWLEQWQCLTDDVHR